MKKVFLIILCITLISFFAVNFFQMARQKIVSSNLKGFVEKKIEDIFGAQISINTINIGLLKYITLSGLQINQELSQKLYYLVDIKKIVFKYNVLNFFKTNFDQPNKIFLDTPNVRFSKIEIPFGFFSQNIFKKKQPIHIEITDGNISYLVSGLKTRLALTKVNGMIIPYSRNQIAVDFRAEGGDDLSGNIAIDGFFDAKEKKADINISVWNGSVVSESFMPITNLEGMLKIADENIVVKNVTFFIRNIPVNVSGIIKQYDSSPVVELFFSIETKYYVSHFTIFGKYGDLKIKGDCKISRYQYVYEGDIIPQEGGVKVANLKINDDYISEGDFLFTEG